MIQVLAGLLTILWLGLPINGQSTMTIYDYAYLACALVALGHLLRVA